MDRKFIKENCRQCLSSLDVFGLWCHDSANEANDMKMQMCSAVIECPYRIKHPELFERGAHLRPIKKKVLDA